MLALHCSAVDGNVDGLEELLSVANVDVNISNKVSSLQINFFFILHVGNFNVILFFK